MDFGLLAYCTFASKQAVSITLFGPCPNNKRKMRPKDLRACSVPHLLTAYTWQLEILVTALITLLIG